MLKRPPETYDPKEYIIIRGARMHNLKGIDVVLPKEKLVVITGLSGSGKSSLAFDTLFAEGQRRYVESLSAYARQFLGRMSKPDVDLIDGIAPAIAIEQKVNTRNPRSTVGTSTEIYDYLKLLFARIGKTYSPISGKEVTRHRVGDVVSALLSLPAGTRVILLVQVAANGNRTVQDQLNIWQQQGFSRVMYHEKPYRIDKIDLPEDATLEDLYLVIDRVEIDPEDEDLRNRLADSVQTAYFEGHESCIAAIENKGEFEYQYFSSHFEADGIIFEEPSVNLFTFNNPYGACRRCEGFGTIIGIDPDLVIPNRNLSVYDDAIQCWRGEKMSEWKEELIRNAWRFDFPVHTPVAELTQQQYDLLWSGNEYFHGLNDFFRYVEEQSYKIQYRVMMSRYRGRTVCPECKGTRLRKDAGYVKIGGKSISELVLIPVEQLLGWISDLKPEPHEEKVAGRIITEIKNRITYLVEVGLGYLTLNRLSNTLSGGESQRINLATSLGSSLVGSLYILDEPSIGLHPRDTHRLIGVLKKLRDNGNTVIVVEHEEEIIKSSDEIIDIGPEAGTNGGRLVFQGNYNELISSGTTYTAQYLKGEREIPVPAVRRNWNDYILVKGAAENNLKNIDVKFPLNAMTCVTGVSGSGKSSLVRYILYPALRRELGAYADKPGRFAGLEGDYKRISNVEMVDQNPIGWSSRSNPATYTKAYDEIRNLYASTKLAKTRGYKPGFFSFNVEGGRCDVCEGEGVIHIEMQFMADIQLTCEACGGKRFREEVMDITWKERTITDVLEMTVDEAIGFFGRKDAQSPFAKRVVERLLPLQQVGLGYLTLGQSSSTLSGGEAQRVKLASFLSKGAGNNPTLFIFDEPTTGLHFHDISRLLKSFDALIENGHTVIVVEHNMDVVKYADWVIDLGPDGGEQGGYVTGAGTPEELAQTRDSYTARFLKPKLHTSPGR
ncbi:MAG: excinuclease ABC subunit UvrA [Bacteroidales bacterium]